MPTPRPESSSTSALALPLLRVGDKVAVVAPSSPIRAEMLDAGLQQVRALGLTPLVRDDVGARHRFTAGDDARRVAELNDALADDSIRGVFFARGGYGVTPLLPLLSPPGAASPRVILGESDATALGCWAMTHGLGWLHGPMVAGTMRQGSAGFSEDSLRRALFEPAGEEAPQGTRALAAGEAEGVLWGGCLTLLAALCGTPWMPRLAGSLLVIEDTGVKPYQVHRMLVQLRDAGALQGVRGVVLGDFSDCIQHPEQGYDVADVIAELLAGCLGPVPVTIGWPIGHAAAPHLTLPMGARARLVVPPAGEPARLAWRR